MLDFLNMQAATLKEQVAMHIRTAILLEEPSPMAARKKMEGKLKLWHEMQMRKFYGEHAL